jgi:hypothetical protein
MGDPLSENGSASAPDDAFLIDLRASLSGRPVFAFVYKLRFA